MFRFKIAFFALVVTFAHWTTFQSGADAGLLRDWLARRRARRAQSTCLAPAQSTFAAAAPVNTVGFNGLQPGQCATTCQQTCSRVVVNYVPCTSYRTSVERVPVTQFRPQTSTDPCTGCTTTCMRPCTTFTYRTKRVPFTTYRPVYRRENYRVPVTTITNNCNSCGVAPTCDTCQTGGSLVGQQVLPATQSFQTVPNGTITTDGSFSQGLPPTTVTPLPTPADSTPSIISPQNSNQSVIDALGGSSTKFEAPQTDRRDWTLTSTKPANRDWSNVPVTSVAAAASPVTKKWTYSPVKQASYESVDASEAPEMKTIRGQLRVPAKPVKKTTETNVNQHWKSVDW